MEFHVELDRTVCLELKYLLLLILLMHIDTKLRKQRSGDWDQPRLNVLSSSVVLSVP